MTDPEAAEQSRIRFHVALQETRFWVYCVGFAIAVLSAAVRIITIDYPIAIGLFATGVASAIAFGMAYRRNIEAVAGVRLAYIWLVLDVFLCSLGVRATGGMDSAWYLWYVSVAGEAAFVAGLTAAEIVSVLNLIGYLVVLRWTGDIHGLDHNFYVAVVRMVFLSAASFFFLRGISMLQERRMTIQRLKEEESRKVAELSRVTSELDLRTQELSEANRRIREADRMKTQFLANMSHELRTPLNSIIGFSEILAERLDGRVEPKYLTFINHVLASGQHLLGIINDLLDLSKIEAGKMELYPEKFAVRDTVTSVLSVMRTQAEKQNVTFNVAVADGLPDIECDPAKFKQILYNLLSNAVKFSPSGSTVDLAARSEPRNGRAMVQFEVRDHGIGIAPEDQKIVFEEFRQVDGSARREFGGTGLGLAIVKRFVELQQGEVGVTSELGKGSCFWFALPVEFSAAKEATVIQAPQDDDHPVGERVLVIEDDTIAWESLSRHLESGGYIPVRAHHGDEALRLASLVKPVAITLDILLPGIDGWEVLKKLKNDQVTASIPVVIVSMVDNRELGLALGAHDYFLKPVDRARLVERLRQITNRRIGKLRPKLLLIDDDETFHDMMEDELHILGYDLDRAYNGENGVSLAVSNKPDVIILDLMMPGMSGFEVAEVLKETPETSQIPILVMTAKDLTDDDRQQLSSKIAALVPKGLSAKSRLIAAIQQLEPKRKPVEQ